MPRLSEDAHILPCPNAARLSDPAIPCHRDHEQPVGDQSECHHAEDPRTKRLSKELLQCASQARRLARIESHRCLDEEQAHKAQHHPSGRVTETAPASDPGLFLRAHLAELKVLPELRFVGLVQLREAVTGYGHPDYDD